MEDDSYEARRSKNNQSVKRSRAKYKDEEEIMKIKLDEIKEENITIANNIKTLENDLVTLKSSFLRQSGPEASKLTAEQLQFLKGKISSPGEVQRIFDK